ncbi:MAG: hypothetical protein GEV08_18940 [Acidimicrobiia bacterium]|nr:hypothetical protein [Acidimicrobiia bacterium]
MTCEEWSARYLAGEVSAQAEAHLRGCASCRRARPQLDQLRSRLGDPAVWESPGPGLAEDVLDSVRAGTAAAATPRPARPRHRRRGWRLAGAAAAVLAALAGFALWPRAEGPDWRLALEATTEAPGAVASVEGWRSVTGTRMQLDVEGLAPSGEGAYYAIWLTSPDGRHVPAGTFRGSGTVVGWAGVGRDEFPRVWVTLEQADGDEALSGTTVLDTPGA